MGETRVDLLHLLEDLRDAYPGSLEETILTEIVANSLDSDASRINFSPDPEQSTLTIVDDGSGMQRRDLARYHDLAASTKTRGQGIGFAGVGIKLGLLVCGEVLTETRRGKTHVASTWHLSSRHRAPWKWTPPPGLVGERGTAVRLKLHTALSPLLDPGLIEGTLRRHYEPLFDPEFDAFLAPHYPRRMQFEIKGQILEKQPWATSMKGPLEIRLAGKRKPSAIGYLIRDDAPLSEERRGVGISTFGKIIKRGWDWLGVTPGLPDRIGGLIEAPALAACLTLNKGDFVRVGHRGGIYLAYRKAIQEAVSRQLAAWGDAREPAEEARRRQVRPLERDLERVLEDLSDEFPLLASLVERRAGGQKRLPIGAPGEEGDVRVMAPAAISLEAEKDEPESSEEALPAEPRAEGKAEEAEPAHVDEPMVEGTLLPAKGGARRPTHYGLRIQFEDRPDDPEVGRLVESTVWVNQAHPAYRRAEASRSVGYHICLAVALALTPLAAEPVKEHEFLTAFLTQWGKALEGSKGQRRRRSR